MKSLAPSSETVNLSFARFHIYTDYQVWIGGSVDGGCHAVSWVGLVDDLVGLLGLGDV